MARGVVGALIGAGLLALVGLVIGLITGIQIGSNDQNLWMVLGGVT